MGGNLGGASASTNTWSVVLGAGAETDASGVLGSETAARTRTARAARARTWPRARDKGATPVAKEEAAAALAIVLGLTGPEKNASSWRVRSLGSPGAREAKELRGGRRNVRVDKRNASRVGAASVRVRRS